MINSKNTVLLARALAKLGVDIRTEIEITHAVVPGVEDTYSCIYAAQNLLALKIPVERAELKLFESRIATIIPVHNTPGLAISIYTDISYNLMSPEIKNCDVTISHIPESFWTDVDRTAVECTPEGHHIFRSVDISMFLSLPELLTGFVEYVWDLIFADTYSDDWVQMARISLDDLAVDRDLCADGVFFDELVAGPGIEVSSNESFVTNLLALSARLFLQSNPNHGPSINFTLVQNEERKQHMVLAIDE